MILIDLMESIIAELFEQEEVMVKITAGEIRNETDTIGELSLASILKNLRLSFYQQ